MDRKIGMDTHVSPLIPSFPVPVCVEPRVVSDYRSESDLILLITCYLSPISDPRLFDHLPHHRLTRDPRLLLSLADTFFSRHSLIIGLDARLKSLQSWVRGEGNPNLSPDLKIGSLFLSFCLSSFFTQEHEHDYSPQDDGVEREAKSPVVILVCVYFDHKSMIHERV